MSYYTNPIKTFDRYDFDCRCEIKAAEEVNNLLDVTKGEDENSVIISYPHTVQVITFSPKAPYYELKQEWKTKLRLSSGVTYDTDSGHYVGVFHNLSIRTWTSLTDDIQHTNKYVFPSPILKILPRENSTSLIIFKNGFSVTLPYGIENKTLKVKGLIKDVSLIEEAASYTWNKIDYICYIVRDRSKQCYIVTCPLRDEGTDSGKVETVKVLRNDTDWDVQVTAKHIVASGTKFNPFIFITWNDTKWSKYDLIKKCWKHYKVMQLRPFWSDLATAFIQKNYFMFYGITYKDQSTVGAPNIDPRKQSFMQKISTNKFYKKTKVYCPVNNYAIIVDEKSINLWSLNFIKHKQTQLKYDLDTVLTKVCRVTRLPYFPVLGWTENKVLRRSKSNIYMQNNMHRRILNSVNAT